MYILACDFHRRSSVPRFLLGPRVWKPHWMRRTPPNPNPNLNPSPGPECPSVRLLRTVGSHHSRRALPGKERSWRHVSALKKNMQTHGNSKYLTTLYQTLTHTKKMKTAVWLRHTVKVCNSKYRIMRVVFEYSRQMKLPLWIIRSGYEHNLFGNVKSICKPKIFSSTSR